MKLLKRLLWGKPASGPIPGSSYRTSLPDQPVKSTKEWFEYIWALRNYKLQTS